MLNLYSDQPPRFIDIKRAPIPTLPTDAPQLRIDICGSSTLTALADSLQILLPYLGIRAEVQDTGFGQMLPTLLGKVENRKQKTENETDDPPSLELRRASHKPQTADFPSLLIVIPDAPSLYDGVQAPDAQSQLFFQALQHAAGNYDTILVANIFPLVPDPDCRIFCQTFNHQPSCLSAFVVNHSNAYTIDAETEAILAPSSPSDPRLYYYGHYTYSPDFQAQLAWRIAGIAMDLTGQRKRVIVVDLDNTLWGGIAGEDGIDGIRIGSSNEGRPYRDMQLALQTWQSQGILLAIVSKNDEPLALDILDQHPGMILRKPDFAAYRINWQNKADNLKEIASELNLGLDSFIFLDDQPAERALIREALPEVLVPELPSDPTRWPMLIRRLICCTALHVSDEDSQRSQRYQQRQAAKALQQTSVDMDSYLRNLKMVVTCASVTPATLPRVAQLIAKTNQFNLTTRRHSLQTLETMLRSEQHIVTCMRLTDTFGDHGIIGVGILIFKDQYTVALDSFLLSCRVIGRRAEHVLFYDLMERARKKGAQMILAKYIPTARNGQLRELLSNWGFTDRTEDDWHEKSLDDAPLQTLDVFAAIKSDS